MMFFTCFRKYYFVLVFPPAPQKGMVKFPGKGTLSARQQAKRALLNMRRQAKRASSKLNLILSYINLCPLA